jgi:hypothetical protein
MISKLTIFLLLGFAPVFAQDPSCVPMCFQAGCGNVVGPPSCGQCHGCNTWNYALNYCQQCVYDYVQSPEGFGPQASQKLTQVGQQAAAMLRNLLDLKPSLNLMRDAKMESVKANMDIAHHVEAMRQVSAIHQSTCKAVKVDAVVAYVERLSKQDVKSLQLTKGR